MIKQWILQSLRVGAAGALGGLLSDCSKLSHGYMSPLDGLTDAAVVFAITAAIWFLICVVRGKMF